jgi:hypothetical protein
LEKADVTPLRSALPALLLALAACASQSESMSVADASPTAAAQPALDHGRGPAAGTYHAMRDQRSYVMAHSVEDAEYWRTELLGHRAVVAHSRGDWGFRVDPEWREAPVERWMILGARSGESAPPADRAFFLDVAYLRTAPDVIDQNTFRPNDFNIRDEDPKGLWTGAAQEGGEN